MSELEIQRRKEYKRNRKRWMIVQLFAIILVAVIALGSFLIYNRMNRTYYIEYTENGIINYKVQYEENEFFEDEWIGKDQAYISSLIEGMTADFIYRLNTDSSDLHFNYRYKIDAKLLIASKDTGAPYYTFEENIFPPKEAVAQNGTRVQINETVSIDYVKYNQTAKSFVDTYHLKNTASCTLIVTLDVEILSSSKQFEKENQNRYTTSLNIPLALDTFNIHTTASSPDNEIKVLEYQDIADRDLLFIIGVSAISLDALLVLVLFIFLHLTKNEDITYAAKIRKILRAYGSYIQRMEGEFDCEGYQIIMIKTFTEMLGIRDTIQSPVVMSENRDETMTRFFVPTNTNILYVFEMKVDNYDEIYGLTEEISVPMILEDVDEQELAEAIAQPDINLSEIEYEPDDDDQFEVTPEEPGVEVVGIVWPEREKHNKVYRYDPNGEVLEQGDLVLVPTRDVAQGRDVIRKVAVAHGNHRVDPAHIKYPLKKIVAIIKRKVSTSLTPKANESAKTVERSETTESKG